MPPLSNYKIGIADTAPQVLPAILSKWICCSCLVVGIFWSANGMAQQTANLNAPSPMQSTAEVTSKPTIEATSQRENSIVNQQQTTTVAHNGLAAGHLPVISSVSSEATRSEKIIDSVFVDIWE